jgi:predicted transcriptional regulator
MIGIWPAISEEAGLDEKMVFSATHMPPLMFEKLREAAMAEERPVSAVIRRAIARYLASEHGEAA